MKRCYALENGGVVEVAPERASVLVFLAPDANDQQEITHLLGLSRADIEAALDPDEISRVDPRRTGSRRSGNVPRTPPSTSSFDSTSDPWGSS
jgi:hypothetical protein